MIPGSNVLKSALRIIGKQTVSYYRYLNSTTNALGIKVSNYDTAISITGSLQPVDRKLYEKNGLDFQKVYYIFYTMNHLMDLYRNQAGDKIVFNGKTLKCESSPADWFAIDGWTGILCVLVEGSNA